MRLVALVAALAIAVSPAAAVEEGKPFGKPLGDAPSVKLSELIAHPDAYVGKTVRVEGVIVDVCAKRGCWMDLAIDAKSQPIRIKVDDGVIVFPIEAKGSQAVAEGVFTKIEMTPEQATKYAKHEAEERGLKPDAAKKANAPTVVYQIAGTGAVIK